MPRDPGKLGVFHRAHQLVLDVYELTDRLPSRERYGLSAQLRRAAVSIPTNIVEGCIRRTAREYRQFVDVALGFAAEVRYLLRLAVDLHYLDGSGVADCQECSDHVVRELQNLLKAVSAFDR